MRKTYLVALLIFSVSVFSILNFANVNSAKIAFSKPHTPHTGLQKASLVNFDALVANPLVVKPSLSDDTMTWGMLGKIKYVTKPHKDYPDGVMFPIVDPQLKALKGKQITISGFIIPIDNVSYALSKNVFAQCFFCGQAGPETIMGIQFKDLKKRLKTDQYVTLVGNFRYNENDIEDWIYHIDNAVIIKGN
ncbi:MAG TPA: hypothetical protein VLZ11_07765 [Flavobacterium sp.]|nr:hypothetical protein [Flavobacterium sp.]